MKIWLNKLAKLRYASRVHFASNSFGLIHFVLEQFRLLHMVLNMSTVMTAIFSATLSTSMSATTYTSMSAAMSSSMSTTTMSSLWGLREDDRNPKLYLPTYLRTYQGNNHWQVRSRYWDRNCIQEMFWKGKHGRELGSEGWLRKGSKVVDPPASLFLTVVSAELESYALKWGSVRHFHWTKLNDTVRKWWERAKIYGGAYVREEITTWCQMQT